MAELIEIPFGWVNQVGPKKRVLDGVEISPWEGPFWKSIVSHGFIVRCKSNNGITVLLLQ